MAASKKHLPIVLLFGVITAALVICTTPDLTWANLDYDLFDFMYAGTYLQVGHAAGFPLYTLLAWLATRLPGNDAWNLAFCLSVVPTLITCVLIFYVVARKAVSSIAPYVATIVFAGSMVIFSQAIIPEVYALTVMLMIAAYVLMERGNYKLGMLAIGFGIAVHYLAVLALPVLIWRYLAPNWRTLLHNLTKVMYFIPPLLLYLYIPLANRAPNLTIGPTSIDSLYQYLFYHGNMLLNLPIWQLPQRMGEGIAVMLASLGIAVLFVLVGMFKRENRTLLWLAAPGVIYYLTTLGPTAYVHMTPAFAFMAIAAGYSIKAVPRTTIEHYLKRLAPIALIGGLVLLGINTYTYDIGRTLDPAPTGARQFISMLDNIADPNPRENVIVCWDAVTYAGIHYYNKQTGRNLKAIHPVFTDPYNALPHELARYPELNLDYGNLSNVHIPPPSGDWLADFTEHILEHTRVFATNNPHVDVYATLSNLEDRTRRGINLVLIPPNEDNKWYLYKLSNKEDTQ